MNVSSSRKINAKANTDLALSFARWFFWGWKAYTKNSNQTKLSEHTINISTDVFVASLP